MKTFLYRTAIFAAIILAIVGGAEWYVEQLPNPYRDKHRWMLNHAHEVKTLILGSSHTYYGVCPEDLGDSAMSLANVSQTYRYDRYLLGHYDMPNLRYVILPYSYSSLWEDFETQGEDNFVIAYRLYMDCDLHSRFSKYGLECLYIPSFKEKLKTLVQPRRMEWSERGWGMEYTLESRAEDWDNGTTRAQSNTYTELLSDNIALLDDIAAWCKSRSVTLLIVRTPVTSTFAANTDARQEAVNDRCLQSLLKRHPEVVMVDVYRDSRFGSNDFYDSDHLNVNGAHKLSAIIHQTILCAAPLSKREMPVYTK